MSLLIALIIGVLIGSVVGYFTLQNIDSLLITALMGLSGAIIGLAFYLLFLSDNYGTDDLFNLTSTLCSTIGALLATLAFAGLHSLMSKRTIAPLEDKPEEDEDDED